MLSVGTAAHGEDQHLVLPVDQQVRSVRRERAGLSTFQQPLRLLVADNAADVDSVMPAAVREGLAVGRPSRPVAANSSLPDDEPPQPRALKGRDPDFRSHGLEVIDRNGELLSVVGNRHFTPRGRLVRPEPRLDGTVLREDHDASAGTPDTARLVDQRSVPRDVVPGPRRDVAGQQSVHDGHRLSRDLQPLPIERNRQERVGASDQHVAGGHPDRRHALLEQQTTLAGLYVQQRGAPSLSLVSARDGDREHVSVVGEPARPYLESVHRLGLIDLHA